MRERAGAWQKVGFTGDEWADNVLRRARDRRELAQLQATRGNVNAARQRTRSAIARELYGASLRGENGVDEARVLDALLPNLGRHRQCRIADDRSRRPRRGRHEPVNSDLERVMAAMREAGWRSSDEWLLSTAVKRLATARYHRECAGTSREAADYIDDELPEYRRRFIDISLRHEVRAAERSGQITRAVRDIALKLVPTWTGDPVELLIAAEAIASVDVPGERATSASSAIAAVADPPLKMAR